MAMPFWVTIVRVRPIWWWLSVPAIMAGIFVADVLTGIDIAVSVLYVAVIVLAMWSGSRRIVEATGAASITLTIVSFVLTSGWTDSAGLANTCISVVAIISTSVLAVRIIVAAERGREIERALAHVSRLSMLGELSAAIEHEVSQPLTAIVANGTAARRWLAAVPPNLAEAEAALQLVVSEADRGGAVLDRVRALARRDQVTDSRAALRDCFDRLQPLIGAELRRHEIALETDIPANLPAVAADVVQVQQVLLNLVLNAIAAMTSSDPGRRTLSIVAASHHTEVVIRVEDSGAGIAAGQLETVFEPFYSTRPEGLGLGLAICRSIVERSGGRIWVEPLQPGGTRFSVALPVARQIGKPIA